MLNKKVFVLVHWKCEIDNWEYLQIVDNGMPIDTSVLKDAMHFKSYTQADNYAWENDLKEYFSCIQVLNNKKCAVQ